MPARPGLRPLLRLLGRRMPVVHGRLSVEGVHDEVLIGRDRWGIPFVDAESDHDAWFGLGFCHGQDRAFQLELLARAGRGTLAELLGAPALPLDRLSRTLGFARLARAQRPLLHPSASATLEAYVSGVNASIASGPRPHELVLLRAPRTRWEVTDVLAFLGLQSLALAGNWDNELARLQILLSDGPDALLAVDPSYGPWLPAVTPPGAVAGPSIGRLAADLGRLRGLVGGAGASNAWAIGPERTRSGAPILANDPHLAPSVPAPWYLAHLRTPEWEVAGASFVGGPAFPSGHNGTIAWGITAACTDAADLFWEELDLDASTSRGPDGPEPVSLIREPIAVRGAPPELCEVRYTSRGPLVTPLLDGVPLALSLRATWLEPAPVRGFIGAHRARDFDGFREAFSDWRGPALNVVYADVAGHVGWQLVGTLPRRRSGNGTLPAPAWEPAWEEQHLPFEALPWCLDPPTGFVASANNAPRPDEPDAPFLGVDWLDGYRAVRISAALEARDDWDMSDVAALQLDQLAVPWSELRDLVLGAPVDGGPARLGRAMLEGWNGEVSAASAAASVYELLLSELSVSVARGLAPRSWRWALGDGPGEVMPRTSFGARNVSQLVATLRSADHGPMIAAALAVAVDQLRARFGADPARWAWGRVRPLRLLHALGVQRPFDRLLNLGPVPLGGDANTVAQAGVRPLDPLANPAAIANHRTVIDLADLDRSRYVLAGGQSGNPASPHYADLFALWQRGEGVPIAWSPAAVAAATVDRLRLTPPSAYS